MSSQPTNTKGAHQPNNTHHTDHLVVGLVAGAGQRVGPSGGPELARELACIERDIAKPHCRGQWRGTLIARAAELRRQLEGE